MAKKDKQLRISKAASLKLDWLAQKSGLSKKELASKIFDSCDLKNKRIVCKSDRIKKK